LDLFSCLDLEADGTLNPDNEVHLFALHWTYLPQLQRHLGFFQEAWNNHKIRTAGKSVQANYLNSVLLGDGYYSEA